MLGDTNTFRPPSAVALALDAIDGAELAEARAKHLEESAGSDVLVREIEGERNRLAAERAALLAGRAIIGGIFDPLRLAEQAASLDALISQLETFVSEVVPRLEAKIAKGDAEAAARLERACRRILSVVRGTSAIDDQLDNARQTVSETVSDLKTTSEVGAVVFLAVGALALAFYIYTR